MKRMTLAILLASLTAGSCSMRQLEGDRLLARNQLQDAEAAYRAFVGKHQSTTRGQEALYKLALLYSLPDSPLYDPGQSRTTLRRVVVHPEGGIYSRHALLLLELQAEIAELRNAASAQASLAAQLESALGRMEEEAAQASDAAGAQQDRARRLANEIRALRSEIDRLTVSLKQREREIERIKEIDLGRLP